MTTTLKDYHYAVETGEALVRAAQVGDLAKVTQLLDEGAGPGYRNFKAVRNANGRRNQPVQCQTGGNPAVPARCARRRPRPGTHGSDAGSGPAPVAVITFQTVSRNVGSVPRISGRSH